MTFVIYCAFGILIGITVICAINEWEDRQR